MSSILKALKKLEHEKSGHVPDLLKIDSDILKSTDSSRSFSLPSLGLLLLFFGSGVVVAFFIMRGANVPPATIKFQPDVSSKSVQPLAPPALLNRETFPVERAIAPAHAPLHMPGSHRQGSLPESSEMLHA